MRGCMSKLNYTIRKTIKNNGKPRITSKIEDIVEDAFDGVHTIRDLDDVYCNVAAVVNDMIHYMVDEDPNVDIINFKVVANENNNTSVTKMPFMLDVFYRHKDSTIPTQLNYTIDEIKPVEKVDKFAPWRK